MKKHLLKTVLLAVGLLLGTTSTWADDIEIPTPKYFNDFSSTDGLTKVGNGEFVVDTDVRFGTIFHNDPTLSEAIRTNYLQLPSNILTDLDGHSAITIGFWVNKKSAVHFWSSPLFTAYKTPTTPGNYETPTIPGSANTWPMLACEARGLVYSNNFGIFDSKEEDGLKREDTFWLDDSQWHYYTVVITTSTITVYVDGEVFNHYAPTGGDGHNISHILENLDQLEYVYLGGSQVWGWNDPDPAFGFDDFVVYDAALSDTQIKQIMAVKNAIGVCKTWETSAAFATAIDSKLAAGDFDTAADVKAFHTTWQIENGSLAKTLFDNTVTKDDWENSWWGAVTEDANYEGMPEGDSDYLARTSLEYNVSQTVYALPAGSYTVSVWTYSSTSDARRIYIANNETNNWYDFATAESSDEGWVKLTANFTLTKTSNVAFGFFAGAVEGRIAGFDNWQLAEVPTYSYTVNAVDGNENVLAVLASNSADSGSSVTVAYPRYFLSGTTLYEAPKTDDNKKQYNKTFSLSENEQVVTIAYTTSTIPNVVFYKEGEDITGMNQCGGSNVAVRCSNAKAGTSSSPVTITTLPAGTYTLYAGLYDNSASSHHTAEFVIGGKTYSLVTKSVNVNDLSQVFTLTEASTVVYNGTSTPSNGLDYLYIVDTPALEVVGATDFTTGYLGAYSTPVTLSPNQKATYTFYNYSDKLDNAHNWLACVGGETFATDALKVALRADNWENVQGGNTGITSNYNWDTFRDEMDGAKVVLSFAYQNNAVIVRADITSKSNNSYFEEFTKKGITGDITVALGVENSFLVITDQATENLPVVTESKTMTDAGWATYCSANALDLTGEIANLTDAYIITGGNNTTKYVYKESVKGQIVPANVGLLLEGTAGEIVFPVAVANAATTDAAGNALVGVTAEKTLDAEAGYVLLKENEVVAFYKNLNDFTLNANTAYLPANFAASISEAPRFYALGGNTTGIDALDAENTTEKATGEIYNLAGQRVGKGYKGLVIMNGKKVIIK